MRPIFLRGTIPGSGNYESIKFVLVPEHAGGDRFCVILRRGGGTTLYRVPPIARKAHMHLPPFPVRLTEGDVSVLNVAIGAFNTSVFLLGWMSRRVGRASSC